MTYAVIWTSANDADFQGRCRAALWDYANKVASGVATYPDQARDLSIASKVLREETILTNRILAVQVLRNTTIAANPAVSTDADIEYQIGQVWDDLLGIS